MTFKLGHKVQPQLTGATELYRLTSGAFTMEVHLEVDLGDEERVKVSLRAFHETEIERAKKATAQADKEPRPCLQCDGMTLDEADDLAQLLAPLTGIREYVADNKHPLGALYALNDEAGRDMAEIAKGAVEKAEKEAKGDETAEMPSIPDKKSTAAPAKTGP